MILVTGGAGFIGANFVLDWLAESSEPVLNLDALTYAGNLESLSSLDGDPRHVFVHGDITDRALLDQLFATHKPRAVVHFAAESHVDRSIHGPGAFIHTNVQGTFTLLEAARAFWSTLAGSVPPAPPSRMEPMHPPRRKVGGGRSPPATSEVHAAGGVAALHFVRCCV